MRQGVQVPAPRMPCDIPCAVDGCKRLVAGGSTYCTVHRQQVTLSAAAPNNSEATAPTPSACDGQQQRSVGGEGNA